MDDWLGSEFGAGVMIGMGILGVPVGLTVDMHNSWLFVAASATVAAIGLGRYWSLSKDRGERAHAGANVD
ncbi:hypothetical protein [Burkholderia sp. Ac-20365]|uniref:hypothetical protein n=1 Tax=Burkholderia sp. Ac-20365 TaxID=2703897 RepID=UPI00197BB89C|nr:hypothetical protein [Burkholderia sp. Ac-20365]MBN3761112.1 hypothetical protein [Burkholderia sp. Ac-20365]